jgi:aspartyl-tRNA(Asn)/glutamyl-tRNA(Gln) amidotransferase subunit A
LELLSKSAGQIADAVNKGEITARGLIGEVLEKCATVNSRLNIFSFLAGEEAIKQAGELDQKIEAGFCLPLAGVPLAIKDDLMYKGLPTGLGTAYFNNFIPPFNATAVDKLIVAGAIVIGKTNTDNMGIESATFSAPNGPTLNPWNPERVAGSAGAAALASGVCSLALESDSGGCMRQGASHCGLYGLRPSSGLVSRHGLALHCGSFGRVGLTAVNAEDLALALKVVSGFDPQDTATVATPTYSINKEQKTELSDMIVGFPRAISKLLDIRDLAVFEACCKKYAALGIKLVELEMSCSVEALRAYHVIAAAEVSSTLSRYDGIRYGKAAEADDLEELYFKTRSATFSRETIRRSIFGTYLLSKGGYDQYYQQALRVWNIVRKEFDQALDSCNFILLPAVRALPHLIAEEPDFLQFYEDDLFTALVSLSGKPALCLPAGNLEDLPVGVQLVGPEYGEDLLLTVAVKLAPAVNKSNVQGFPGGGS